jgi:hypothetical protein
VFRVCIDILHIFLSRKKLPHANPLQENGRYLFRISGMQKPDSKISFSSAGQLPVPAALYFQFPTLYICIVKIQICLSTLSICMTQKAQKKHPIGGYHPARGMIPFEKGGFPFV